MDKLNASQRVLFDDYGNLSDYGTERFWKSLSDYFRRLDRDEHNAIKRFRTHKKTMGTQTYTQQRTNNHPSPNYNPTTTFGQQSTIPYSHGTSQNKAGTNQTHHQIPPGVGNNQSNNHWHQNYHHQQSPYLYQQNDRYHVNNM